MSNETDVGRSTYSLEYTPGIGALITASGRGASQRSGFHVRLSSPQMRLQVFDPRTPTNSSVPCGIGISYISCPSTPRMGCDRGRTVSLVALLPMEVISNSLIEKALVAFYLLAREQSGRWIAGGC